jgi:hypothetical protein
LEIRAIGGNPEASLRLGIPVGAYTIATMMVAGGFAGLAGMAEASAIQGRLVAALSPGYGFTGFLVAWLVGGSAAGILVMAFLFAVVSSVGDILQITQNVPYAVVNLLMAAVQGNRAKKFWTIQQSSESSKSTDSQIGGLRWRVRLMKSGRCAKRLSSSAISRICRTCGKGARSNIRSMRSCCCACSPSSPGRRQSPTSPNSAG